MAQGRRGGPGARFDSHDRLLDAKVASTLDLHGTTGVEAKARATSFLQASVRARPGTVVHIITGRGKNSPAGPVLTAWQRSAWPPWRLQPSPPAPTSRPTWPSLTSTPRGGAGSRPRSDFDAQVADEEIGYRITNFGRLR